MDYGDNPPLALGPVTAAYPVTRLLFKTESPPTLYYGHRQVSAPRYDLALVAGQLLSAEKNLATLGPGEKAQPDGWSATAFRTPYSGVLFWSVLALVVLTLLEGGAASQTASPAVSARMNIAAQAGTSKIAFTSQPRPDTHSSGSDSTS